MKIVFMGTPQAAVPSLERILADGHEVVAVYSQPDRPSGRGNKIVFSAVKEFALERGIAILQPSKIRTPEAFNEFRSLEADVALVVAYGRILPETFLNAFPNGAINLHFSLLPKYRGAAPVNWAIVNGETTTGVTTMKMDAGLDTGDILLQRETAIGVRENSIDLMMRLSIIGSELLSQTLNELGSIQPIAQDHAEATLAPMMKKEDGRFDWSMTAEDLVRRVRGFQPFPTTFTQLMNKRLTIWNCSESEPRIEQPRPGIVLAAHGDEFFVSCGNGTVLKIDELQLEGKRRVPVRDFLNGSGIKAGDDMR